MLASDAPRVIEHCAAWRQRDEMPERGPARERDQARASTVGQREVADVLEAAHLKREGVLLLDPAEIDRPPDRAFFSEVVGEPAPDENLDDRVFGRERDTDGSATRVRLVRESEQRQLGDEDDDYRGRRGPAQAPMLRQAIGHCSRVSRLAALSWPLPRATNPTVNLYSSTRRRWPGASSAARK